MQQKNVSYSMLVGAYIILHYRDKYVVVLENINDWLFDNDYPKEKIDNILGHNFGVLKSWGIEIIERAALDDRAIVDTLDANCIFVIFDNEKDADKFFEQIPDSDPYTTRWEKGFMTGENT